METLSLEFLNKQVKADIAEASKYFSKFDFFEIKNAIQAYTASFSEEEITYNSFLDSTIRYYRLLNNSINELVEDRSSSISILYYLNCCKDNLNFMRTLQIHSKYDDFIQVMFYTIFKKLWIHSSLISINDQYLYFKYIELSPQASNIYTSEEKEQFVLFKLSE